MAVSIKSIAIIMAALGVKAFVFGILAEIKKGNYYSVSLYVFNTEFTR